MNRLLRPASLVALAAFASCNALPYEPPHADALADRAAAIETVLARVRDLPFKHEVPVAEQDKPALKAFLEASLDKDWDKTGAFSERAWKQFGFLPPDMQMKSWTADFMTDQIGGYYDTDTKRYYTIAQGGDGAKDDEKTEPFLLGHELTHALDDQYFDLGATDKKLAYDDDRSLAFHSVCEGNAMDAGLDASFDRVGYPGSFASPLLGLIPALISRFDITQLGGFHVDLDDEQEAAVKKVKDAPRIVQAELGFPYLQGWGFTNRVRSEYGFTAINTALQTPPESTEQILYPDRYLDRLDRPQLIELPAAPEGFHEVYQQTLGLLRTRVLLGDGDELSEIDGWDGDRYVLWETQTGDALGWLSVWDSEGEAADFASEYADCLLKQFGPAGTYAIVRDGNRVAAAINVHDDRAQAVAQHLLTARVTQQDGDEGPDHWYWRTLRWPLSIRSLHTANEFKVAGNWGIDWRSHEGAYKLRLLNSLVLHTENNPDRFGFWVLCGLIGGASDRTVDYACVQVPLLLNWHGRNAGAERRARFGLALDAIEYENLREKKSFDLLWGLLFHAQWGERETKSKGRLLFIPLWW